MYLTFGELRLGRRAADWMHEPFQKWIASLQTRKAVDWSAHGASCEPLAAGVRVALFHGGLLHTKSITVDGEFAFFGSLNLDPRSLYLNFEITLLVYDRNFVAELRELQTSYLRQCELLSLEQWRSRSGLQRLTENTARLLGPLL